MKLLRAIHSLDPAIGGPLESVKQSSLVLNRRGHKVEIITLDAPNDRGVGEFPGVVHAVGPGLGHYGYTQRLVPWLKKQRAKYDAVIVHGIWQYHSFAVWRALHNTTTPYFVFPHGMLDPWFNRTYPLKHLKKLLYWPWAEYRVLRDARAVLFTSAEERRLARESFALYRCNEKVVNYGTAAPTFDVVAAQRDFGNHFPQLRGKAFLLFLGRLHEKKGCEQLLRAFAAVHGKSRLHLLMAGPCADESYLLYLQSLVRELGGEELPITLSGMLSGNLKWGAFSAAEAFALPSHQENFGIAVVEALACGKPVLISNKVNIWCEIVEDGAGFAEQDDLEGTIRLLQRWMKTPAPRRVEMAASAKESFAKRFEIDQAVDSFLELVESEK